MVCLLIPISVAIWMFAVIAVAILPLRLPVGICGGCGYSLRGLGGHGRCPECGVEFNQGSGQPLVPEWGSTREKIGVLVVLLISFVVTTGVCIVLGDSSAGLFAAVVGLASVAPAATLVGLGMRRVSRGVVWATCICGSVIGAAVASAAFIASAASGDAQAGIGMFFAQIAGGTISALVSGVIAGIAAIGQHRRWRELRKRSIADGASSVAGFAR